MTEVGSQSKTCLATGIIGVCTVFLLFSHFETYIVHFPTPTLVRPEVTDSPPVVAQWDTDPERSA